MHKEQIRCTSWAWHYGSSWWTASSWRTLREETHTQTWAFIVCNSTRTTRGAVFKQRHARHEGAITPLWIMRSYFTFKRGDAGSKTERDSNCSSKINTFRNFNMCLVMLLASKGKSYILQFFLWISGTRSECGSTFATNFSSIRLFSSSVIAGTHFWEHILPQLEVDR